MNHDIIKVAAKQAGCRVTDLIALSSNNDPFFCGKPAQTRDAQWFAEVYETYRVRRGAHLRSIHYRLVSQETPVLTPDGTPYANTHKCWTRLVNASKYARYLGLIPLHAFEDHRAPQPIIYAAGASDYPDSLSTNTYSSMHMELPPMPSLPWKSHWFRPDVPEQFHVELWCEKSTMNSVLLPICQRHHCNLVTGVGEMSLTSVDQLFDRAIESGLPVRILYLSDFDPAGKSMPTAVARKCEFISTQRPLDDLKLEPILLTEQQVRDYQLPRTPIKESETRRGHFEDVYGEGAVELDALEAVRPGELKKIVVVELARFRDETLYRRISAAISETAEACRSITEQVHEEFADQIDEATAGFDDAIGAIEDWRETYRPLWDEMKEAMTQSKVARVELPQPEYAEDFDNPLFDSSRSYMDQLERYKSFQHK